MISVHHPGTATALGDLSALRAAFRQCLTTRADTLFELTDAALCADGPIISLVELSLQPEHRRGRAVAGRGVVRAGHAGRPDREAIAGVQQRGVRVAPRLARGGTGWVGVQRAGPPG